MTTEDLRSEMERIPFLPFRVHLVSGKTLDVTVTTSIWLLQNAALILDRPIDPADEGGYNMVSLRNIERLERIGRPG
jgi:hypothetical protein